MYRNVNRLHNYATIEVMASLGNLIRNFYQTPSNSTRSQRTGVKSLESLLRREHRHPSSPILMRHRDSHSRGKGSIEACCFTRKQRKFSVRLGQFPNCLRVRQSTFLFNCMVRVHFPEQTSVDLYQESLIVNGCDFRKPELMFLKHLNCQ